jgi:hypothetical protein
MQAGARVVAQPSQTAPRPTREQLRLLKEGFDRSYRPGPTNWPVYHGPLPKAANAAVAPPDREPGYTTAPGTNQPDQTALTIFRNTVMPTPTAGLKSPVGEPSTDNNGRYSFQTGNWYAARFVQQVNGWTFLDPFTIFGGGFCCDQVTVYDVSHNRQFWLLQYGDHLVLANSGGGDLLGWCFYNWYPSNFGFTNGDHSFDFNHIALSTSFVYVTTHVYGPGGGELVFRSPIDPQAISCGGFSYSWVFRTTEFTDAFAKGVGDTMYWGSNWTDLGIGNKFRAFRWPDDSGSYSWFDRTIDPYVHMFFGGAQNCAGPTTLNWCQRTDSRMGTGYLAYPSLSATNTGGAFDNEAILGFAFNAQQDGSHPYPYVRRIYFRVSDLTYLGFSELWCTTCAILYPDEAPDTRGHVGFIAAFGGGSSDIKPGSIIMLDDDIAQVQGWSVDFWLYGGGNACLNTDGLRRWGDYLTVNTFHPSGYAFVATAFTLTANAGACNVNTPAVQVRNIIFGRFRDNRSVTRWWKK